MARLIRVGVAKKEEKEGEGGERGERGGQTTSTHVLFPSTPPQTNEELQELKGLIQSSLSLHPTKHHVLGLRYSIETDEPTKKKKRSQEKEGGDDDDATTDEEKPQWVSIPFSALKDPAVFGSLKEGVRYEAVIASAQGERKTLKSDEKAKGEDEEEGEDEAEKEEEKEKASKEEEETEAPKAPEEWKPTLPQDLNIVGIPKDSTLFTDETDALIADILNKLHNPYDEYAPRHVLVYIYVTDLEQLSTVDQTCFIDFHIRVWWKDETLKGKEYEDFEWDELWKPDIEFTNNASLESHFEWQKNAWIESAWKSHGIITSYNRYRGLVKAPMQLQRFPFDVQTIGFDVISSSWASSDMVLVNFTDAHSITNMNASIDLTEWERLSDINIKATSRVEPTDRREYSTISVSLDLKRRPQYFIYKIFAQLFLIVALLGVVFAYPVDAFDERMQTTLTLFLTSIAFHFVVAELLPKISYTTDLDQYFNANYLILGGVSLENVVVHRIAQEDAESATFVDRCALVVFGLVLLYCVVSVFVKASSAPSSSSNKATSNNNLSTTATNSSDKKRN